MSAAVALLRIGGEEGGGSGRGLLISLMGSQVSGGVLLREYAL
ncbi:hypothetical protein ACSVIJ_21835 [Pseudomonas sp. NCHU5208]